MFAKKFKADKMYFIKLEEPQQILFALPRSACLNTISRNFNVTLVPTQKDATEGRLMSIEKFPRQVGTWEYDLIWDRFLVRLNASMILAED